MGRRFVRITTHNLHGGSYPPATTQIISVSKHYKNNLCIIKVINLLTLDTHLNRSTERSSETSAWARSNAHAEDSRRSPFFFEGTTIPCTKTYLSHLTRIGKWHTAPRTKQGINTHASSFSSIKMDSRGCLLQRPVVRYPTSRLLPPTPASRPLSYHFSLNDLNLLVESERAQN